MGGAAAIADGPDAFLFLGAHHHSPCVALEDLASRIEWRRARRTGRVEDEQQHHNRADPFSNTPHRINFCGFIDDGFCVRTDTAVDPVDRQPMPAVGEPDRSSNRTLGWVALRGPYPRARDRTGRRGRA